MNKALFVAVAVLAAAACAQAKPHTKAFSAVHDTVDRKPQNTPHGTEGISVAYGVQRAGSGWAVLPHPLTTKTFLPGEYAYGIYTESIDTIGWNMLEVHTNPAYPDSDTAQAAGYFEGYATSQRMYQTAVNNGNLDPMPTNLVNFLNTNSAWMASQIAAALLLPTGDPERVYWTQVSNILQQLQGLGAGYGNSTTGMEHPMSALQILSLSLGGDMEDLSDAVSTIKPTSEELAFRASHCSAMIKLLDGNSDILVSQDTWSTLNSMMRIYKLYDFPWKVSSDGALVPAVRSSFSSYPGSLFSGDDFYVLSSGIIELETTIGNSNPALISKITPQTNLEWLRNMVANRLAIDGYSWTQIYSKFNSGTYNNMNMIVDLNKFTPGQPLKDGTVWIAEQIPGLVKANDMSKQIQAAGYFASYNVAYDPEIRQESGADDLVKQFGPWFSFDGTARAEIFRREAPGVKDLESLQRLMRLCDFKNDPFSTQMDTCQFRGWFNCTPAYTAENTIACRDDLNPADGVFSLPSFGQRNHVATDSKISSYSMFDAKTVPSVAISGPTYDQQPVFQFSTSPYNTSVSWLGMPDYWKFPWVNVYWN